MIRILMLTLLVQITCEFSNQALANCALLSDEEVLLQIEQNIEAVMAEYPAIDRLRGLSEAWQDFKQLSANETIAKRFPLAETARIVSDLELTWYSENFIEFVKKLKELNPLENAEAIDKALREMLETKVPASTIEARIKGLEQPSAESLRRAFGDMTLLEVQELFYGKDFRNPSPESLIGKYIAETGASTLVRTFNETYVQAGVPAPGQGPERLVVAVSQESFENWKENFGRHEFMSIINHADIIHGKNYQPYNGGVSEIALPNSENKIMPIVTLKSSEAQRLAQFFRLFNFFKGQGEGYSNNRAANPWREAEKFCSKSGWAGGCAQKIGNFPIGDKLVETYRFPDGKDNDVAVSKPLENYDSQIPMFKRVWKVPGNEQFAELIGQGAANIRGEFANPGWSIQTLLGPTTNERVPVIFVIRADHKAEIPADFVPLFETPN